MSEKQAITGYQLVRRIFKAYSADPLTKLIKDIAKGETEYLEFKATCVFDKDAPGNKENETQDDLSWNIAREIFALYNSKGGALVIGIDDDFNPVRLPKFELKRQNDYLRTMIRDKIFPRDFIWKTKNGTEVYKCDPQEAQNLINHKLHIEYSKYQGEQVAVLFVEPVPCGDDDACIQIAITRNGGETYDQLPIRQPGNTGGVKLITRYEDKNDYQQKRHITDPAFGQVLAMHIPDLMYGATKSQQRDQRTAVAYNSTDPNEDRLIRSLEGQESESEFAPDTEFDDKYRIVRKIGQGGMGIVYEVEHLDLRENRAIKVFAPITPDDLLKRKFLSEARLLAKFKHPGLVKVHNLAVAADTKTLYYEMDLVLAPTGKPMSLKDVFRKFGTANAPSNKKLREWFSELCNVLGYLHRREATVHRDIKLDNILVNSDGSVMLSDFGIARVEDKSLKEKLGDQMTMHPTMTGVGDANIGTSEYQAPELETEKASDKSDVYALGVVFFKLVTGRTFTGESGEDLRKLLKKCPRFWRRTLPRLLAHNKDKRIGNLKKYAVSRHYPRSLSQIILNTFLGPFFAHFLFVTVSLLIIGHILTQDDWLSKWKTSTTQTPITTPESTNKQDMPAEPKASVHEFESDPAAVRIRIAEKDIRELNNRYIRKNRSALWEFRRPDPNDPDADIFTSLDTFHSEIFSTWETIKELTNIGMDIDEVISLRRDIVDNCANIRQKAIDQLQKISESGDYQKAIKFHTSINSEFRNCGLTEIPRPSFTPKKK